MDNETEPPDLTNGTTFCPELVPEAYAFFQNMSTLLLSFIVVAAVLTVTMLIVFTVKLYYIFKYVSSYTHRPGKLAWLAAIYPYTAMGCLIGICVPRAMEIADIFILLYLARCMFVYIELVIDYFGSRLDMSTQLAGRTIQLNIRPFCGCCFCCPRPEPTVKNIRYVELLVYQVAIIRPLLFLINGVAYADNFFLQTFSTTITILNLISTLTAMYGFMIIANFCKVPLRHYRINVWMRLAQVVIVLFNLQGPIFNLIANFGGIVCNDLLPAAPRAKLWNSFLLIFEMFLLSLASSYLLRPTVNAMFDRHPLHLYDAGGRKGLIKPKASIRPGYGTDLPFGFGTVEGSNSLAPNPAGPRKVSQAPPQLVIHEEEAKDEPSGEAIPLLK